MTTEPSSHWGVEPLWQQLEPLLPGLSVEVLAHTASTNSLLLERARALPAAGGDDGSGVQLRRSVESQAFGRRAADLLPCLLVAEHQTGGRGRHGRSWQSQRGASLTFSLSLPIVAGDWSGLSPAVGVAIAEALDGLPASRIGLKWPNDLWLRDEPGGGRKLGGILIETVAAGPQRMAVIGVGINVLPIEAGAVGSHLASLSELDATATPPAVLARIAPALVQAVQDFERAGFAPFVKRFAARDVLRGQRVRSTDPAVPEGVAEGLNANGEMLLRTPQGLHTLRTGEVSVRVQAEPPC